MSDLPIALSESSYRACIEACTDCAAVCDFCMSACLREPRLEHMTRCVLLAADCADICRLAASAMARESPHAACICELCARVCESCAQECAHHEPEHCQDCAEACRRCAGLCRDMIA